MDHLFKQALTLYRVGIVLWLMGNTSWLIGNLVTSFNFGELAYFGYYFQLQLVRPLVGITIGIVALITSQSVIRRLISAS